MHINLLFYTIMTSVTGTVVILSPSNSIVARNESTNLLPQQIE